MGCLFYWQGLLYFLRPLWWERGLGVMAKGRHKGRSIQQNKEAAKRPPLLFTTTIDSFGLSYFFTGNAAEFDLAGAGAGWT